MTWSFNDALTTALDRVRAAVGDVVTANQLVSNERISAVLLLQPIETYAAAAVADMLAAEFSRKADMASGQTRISLSQQAIAYQRLADRLRAGGAGDLPGGDGTGVPTLGMFSGGTSLSQRDTLRQDTDRIQPQFNLGRDDAQGTGQVNDPPAGWWRNG